jgi:hypothetical protein
MAGFRFVKSLNGHNTGALERFIVKTSEEIHKGDAVRLTTGYIVPAAATSSVLGVANEAVTGDGTKTIEVILADGAVFEATADATLAQAVAGTYFDLTGATGAQAIDTETSGATGQFLVLKTDGATTVQVVAAEKQVTL